MASNPFDIIDSMCSPAYSQVEDIDKGRNFFMINRRLAIGFPLAAQHFNALRVHGASVVDCWADELRRRYKSVPGWTKTRGAKSAAAAKKKASAEWEPKDEAVAAYCRVHRCTRRDYEQAREFFRDRVDEELHVLEKMV